MKSLFTWTERRLLRLFRKLSNRQNFHLKAAMFSFHSKYFVYREPKRAPQKLSFCFKCPDTGTVRILCNILYFITSMIYQMLKFFKGIAYFIPRSSEDWNKVVVVVVVAASIHYYSTETDKTSKQTIRSSDSVQRITQGGDELVNRSYRDRAADDLGHRDVTRNLSREL